MSGLFAGLPSLPRLGKGANLQPHPPAPVEGSEATFLSALHIPISQGWNGWAVYTHAWHEGGNFSSSLVKVHNHFGIKKPKHWTGKVVKKYTREFLASNPEYGYDAEFCAWDDPEEAMGFYCDKIRTMYPNAYENRAKVVGYFVGLMNGPFRWDGDGYVERLERAYKALLLDPSVQAKLDPLMRVA